MAWAKKGAPPAQPPAAGESVQPEAPQLKGAAAAVVNLAAFVLIATFVASGFWLPGLLKISSTLAIVIGFGVGIGLFFLIMYLYLRYLAWRAKTHVMTPEESAALWNRPDVKKMVDDLAADEKELGIDVETKAFVDANLAELNLAMDELAASPDYKTSTKEQQELQMKQLSEKLTTRFFEETKARSKETTRRVMALRERRRQTVAGTGPDKARREADEARLREMQQRAQAGGFTDEKLLAEIQELQLRLLSSKQQPGVTRDG